LLEGLTYGEYELDGVSVHGMGDRERSRLRNKKIGFIFQSFNLIADLTVHDDIEMPLRYRGLAPSDRLRRTTDSLSRVGLAGRANSCPFELSAGQQQRVAIARALAGSPKILLADEPTANLDAVMARGITELIEELHRDGATIVTVTHDQDLAARAQREIHVFNGNIVEHPLLSNPTL
jgi:putative ABC transport system ATP-binding protein